MTTVYIGIDPGKQGAIAAIAEDKIFFYPMPLTGKGKAGKVCGAALRDILFRLPSGNKFIAIERAQAMRKKGATQGVTSSFSFGMGYGIILGVVECLGLPHILVIPQSWKKAILSELSWKGNKKASIEYCQRRWPDAVLRRTERCTTDDDGYADALCLAEFARMRHATS